MATRGVFQLQKLRVIYCDWGGSSRGTRDFIRERIVQFAEQTPAAEVVTEVKRGRHPSIIGEYISGARKAISVRNMAPHEIMKHAYSLRNCNGRRVRYLPVVSITMLESRILFLLQML